MMLPISVVDSSGYRADRPAPDGATIDARNRQDVARRRRNPHLVGGPQLIDADAANRDLHRAIRQLECNLARRARQDAVAVRRRLPG